MVASRPDPPDAGAASVFQSPSLRGSGRFSKRMHTVIKEDFEVFQSPSLRGSGRFLPPLMWGGDRASFQSPSLRGSGRFDLAQALGVALTLTFQSPSLRGSGRFMRTPRCVG